MAKTLLQINVTANVGSTGRLTEDLGKIAIDKGWHSYIAYGRHGQNSASRLIKIGSKIEIWSHVLLARLFDRSGFGSYWATKRFIKQIDKIKPDIIQCHNLHGYYINIAVLFEYLAKKNYPIIWSLHDCWTMTGHCAHFALAECNKWQTECSSCPLTKEYPRSLCVDSSKRNYRDKKQLFTLPKRLHVISVSKWLGQIVKCSYLNKYPVSIIANGIDIDIYRPRNNSEHIRLKYGINAKFMIIAAGTAWAEEKGLYDYYKLRDALSDDYAIVLVGLTPEQIKALPDGVIGLPRTNNPDELAELYSAADVLLSLSYLEAFGLTPVEAFACGTPAIVYNCTSLPELITPEVGLITESGDIDALVCAIEQVNNNGKAYYTENCRKYAEIFYARNARFGDYINLYEEILNKNR